MRVALISAKSFEFDSRGLNIAGALAAAGHDVVVLALRGEGLPNEENLGERLRLVRVDVDRTIISALRPMPDVLRRLIARAIGLDPTAEILPADSPRGLDRLRHPLRRFLELLGHARRVGPWTDAALSAAPQAHVFQTSALPALAVARAAAHRLGAKYVYDLADYQTEAARIARLPAVLRNLALRRERSLVSGAAGALAASPGIADVAERALEMPRPRVVLNCPPAWLAEAGEAVPRPGRLRDLLGIAAARPLILHHGQFKLDRGIEELVRASDHRALREIDAAVVFLGFGRLEGILREAARMRPGRMFVVPAVPIADLLEHVADADIGYLGCPPRTLNLRITLPNKLFECLMAGVPVLAAHGTQMAELVTRDRVGQATDVESAEGLPMALAAMLTRPADERDALRRRCRDVALSKYAWEMQATQVVDVYREVEAQLMSPEGKRVLAALVNYNGAAMTLAAVESFVEQESAQSARLIVVDNGSTAADDVAALETGLAGRATLVRLETNRGYAAACNEAARIALAEGMEYVLWLNNDVLFETGMLEALVEHMDSAPGVAAAAAAAVTVDAETGRTVLGAGMDYSIWRGRVRHRHEGIPIGELPVNRYSVEVLAGTCVMARLDALRRIGGLDESYFMYGEDVDWSIRARAAGYELHVVPQARVRHSVAASSSTAMRLQYLMRNTVRVVRARGSLANQLLFVPYFFLGWLPAYTIGRLVPRFGLREGLRLAVSPISWNLREAVRNRRWRLRAQDLEIPGI